MPLTDTKVRQAKAADKPYRLPDGNGLYLEVRPTGARFWRYRFELPPGKESIYTIGEYPAISLAAARENRDWARQRVRDGVNPTAAREDDRRRVAANAEITFKSVAEDWIAQEKADWTAGYCGQIEAIFRDDVYPEIGHLPVNAISSLQVLDLLRKIEARGASTIALLARQRCSSVFRFAISTVRAEIDPTAALYGALKRKAVRHHPHLTREQIPKLLEAMGSYGGYIPTKTAMRLLLLAFTRTGELRKAEWDEFDLAGDRLGLGGPAWLIPKERMKMRRPHIVPLATQAVTLLTDLHGITGGGKYLFPNLRTSGTCMTITTINRALERMGFGGQFSGHGFRSTASTALHEMGYPSDHIEAQLAHIDQSVRGSYNHAIYLPERRKMMQDWADLIDSMDPRSPS
jgi:integrase